MSCWTTKENLEKIQNSEVDNLLVNNKETFIHQQESQVDDHTQPVNINDNSENIKPIMSTGAITKSVSNMHRPTPSSRPSSSRVFPLESDDFVQKMVSIILEVYYVLKCILSTVFILLFINNAYRYFIILIMHIDISS